MSTSIQMFTVHMFTRGGGDQPDYNLYIVISSDAPLKNISLMGLSIRSYPLYYSVGLLL